MRPLLPPPPTPPAMRRSLLVCAALVAATAGCYRVTVNTGAPLAPETLERPWNHSFVYGLVPPAEVSTKEKCPTGVAQVVTQRSFLNSLVAALTTNIYTPLEIKATCAAGPVLPAPPQ